MVAFSNAHTIVLKADGTVWSCGLNSEGQMGNGTTQHYTVPILTPVQASISDVKFIAGGNGNTYAIKKDGTLWAWGFNGNGELCVGDKQNRSLPTQVPGLSNVIQISGINAFSAACLTADGKVYTWGSNQYGQLGNGTTTDSLSPVQATATGFEDIKGLDVGSGHVVARKGDDTVWTWGANMSKQCGRGTSSYYTEPGPVTTTGVENIVKVKAGSNHTVALKGDGTVWTWGWNKYGQLGKGYVLDGDEGEYLNNRSYNPALVPGLSAIADIDAGGYQTMVKKGDGTVWFVGYNYRGQFGDGNALVYLPNATEEFRQTLITGTLLQMETQGNNTGFVKTDGTLWTCGANSVNQVGTGVTSSYIDVPYRVRNLNLLGDPVLAGDLNGSGGVDLADAVAALRIVSGTSPEAGIRLRSDVNGDLKIGLEEALFILQAVAGLRENQGMQAVTVRLGADPLDSPCR